MDTDTSSMQSFGQDVQENLVGGIWETEPEPVTQEPVKEDDQNDGGGEN